MYNEITYIPYKKSNKNFASTNRHAMTRAEQRIWFEIVQKRPLGYKFIRQKRIGSFILDFYCAKLMLGIEIDGSSHDDKQEYDAMRESKINALGITIIRYTNDQVIYMIEDVDNDLIVQIQKQQQTILSRTQTPPPCGHLPLSGETDSQRLHGLVPPDKGDTA